MHIVSSIISGIYSWKAVLVLTYALILFAVSLGISMMTMPFLKNFALKHRVMLDIPNERKVHTKMIARNGGLGVALATFTAILLGVLIQRGISGGNLVHLSGIALGSAVIVCLGVYDDIKGLKAHQKLIGQTFASILLVLFGISIRAINIPFFGVVHFPLYIRIFATIFWMLAVINAMNLIDGIDGLAGGAALIASLTLFTLAFIHQNILMVTITVSLAGACLGFLRYNYPPATLFMGDCGSMFLGFLLASASIEFAYKGPTFASILMPMTLLGMPLMDTTLSIVRRLWRGQHPFSADHEHIHHQLLSLGLCARHASLILYGVCGFLGVVALVISLSMSEVVSVITVMVATLILIVGSVWLYRPQLGQKLLHKPLRNYRTNPGKYYRKPS